MTNTGSNQTITANLSTMYYDDYGKGEVPIIFIHGFPFDKSMWQPQLNFLKSNHRVIAFDIRGFGKSVSRNENECITSFADDLVEFMDVLEINKAIVCGLSMGGYILLNALNRYPEKFKAIILCDTQCIADTQEVKEIRNRAIVKIKKDGMMSFTDEFIKSVFCAETLLTKHELVESARNTILRTPAKTITSGLTALSERIETCSMLDKVNLPTLIICGIEDILTPLAQSQFLQRSIKHSKLVSIPHAGHLSNLEQPEIFNAELSVFIESLLVHVY